MLGNLMEKEIREQPAVLLRGATTYFAAVKEAVKDRNIEMVLLAARGSSDNAALYARYLIEIFLGISVSLAAPSVLTRYKTHVRYRNALGIGISQSGAAPDVSEVMTAMREEGHLTVAITNTPDSRLTKACDATILLDAGPEKSVAATKTYSASLLALYELTRALGAELPEPAAFMPTDEWVETAREAAVEASGAVVRSAPVFALGRGYGFSTCEESALKLMECALISCKAYSSADFEHGPKALAGHGSAAISYEGAKPNLAAQGCQIIVAPKPPASIPEPFTPMWEVIFGQWVALTAARSRGLNPDDPQHLLKVTETL